MSNSSTMACLQTTTNSAACLADEAVKHPLQYLYIIIPVGVLLIIILWLLCYCYCKCCCGRKRRPADLSQSLIEEDDPKAQKRMAKHKQKREHYQQKYGDAISTYHNPSLDSENFYHTQQSASSIGMFGKMKNYFSGSKRNTSMSSRYTEDDAL